MSLMVNGAMGVGGFSPCFPLTPSSKKEKTEARISRNGTTVMTRLPERDYRPNATLADQLKRSEYRNLPLPYVWYHDFQSNWWLSSSAGSKAIGTFEEAVSALADVTANKSSSLERAAAGRE